MPNRGEVIVIPIRRPPTIACGLEPGEISRKLSQVRAELQYVEEAITTLERLAARRFVKRRGRISKPEAERLSCGSGRA